MCVLMGVLDREVGMRHPDNYVLPPSEPQDDDGNPLLNGLFANFPRLIGAAEGNG